MPYKMTKLDAEADIQIVHYITRIQPYNQNFLMRFVSPHHLAWRFYSNNTTVRTVLDYLEPDSQFV